MKSIIISTHSWRRLFIITNLAIQVCVIHCVIVNMCLFIYTTEWVDASFILHWVSRWIYCTHILSRTQNVEAPHKNTGTWLAPPPWEGVLVDPNYQLLTSLSFSSYVGRDSTCNIAKKCNAPHSNVSLPTRRQTNL